MTPHDRGEGLGCDGAEVVKWNERVWSLFGRAHGFGRAAVTLKHKDEYHPTAAASLLGKDAVCARWCMGVVREDGESSEA